MRTDLRSHSIVYIPWALSQKSPFINSPSMSDIAFNNRYNGRRTSLKGLKLTKSGPQGTTHRIYPFIPSIHHRQLLTLPPKKLTRAVSVATRLEQYPRIINIGNIPQAKVRGIRKESLEKKEKKKRRIFLFYIRTRLESRILIF